MSPVEATEAYLERIDRLNPTLHAYLTVCAEEAMSAARESEQAVTRGEYRGPMHGIPVAVKDQVKSRGIRTTCGPQSSPTTCPMKTAPSSPISGTRVPFCSARPT